MRAVLTLAICVVLQSCAIKPKVVSDAVYSFEGGKVSVVNDYGDCFISIDGPINKSLEKAFNQAIIHVQSMECVEEIVLITSHGGDLDTALHIGREIRSNQFSTDIHGFCDSACAFVYVGGIRRFAHQNSRISSNSKLGVHQPASELLFHQCVVDRDKFPIPTQKISQYLAQMLSKDAAMALSRAMFEIPCNQIAYMDANVLLKSGIATENVDFH
jgi:hypothetical protein